ncbi:MAG: beta-ketoacyl-ACP synthase II [Spirochaetia bacterium]|nr:beta-ketoacyl-ACP synthase II [Spirochaetia bacterium]
MKGKRVVITGLGTVNPLGNNVSEFWQGLMDARCGIGLITRYDVSDSEVKIAGEVRDFDPSSVIDRKTARRMDLFSQYAVYASAEAIKDASFEEKFWDGDRAGLVLGVGTLGWTSAEEGYGKIFSGGESRVPVFTIPKIIPNLGAGNAAMALQLHGPCFSLSTACASGADAIGNAARLIESGYCDVMLAGGTEAGISRLCMGGFAAIQALTMTHNDSPEISSRPFDRDRDGFVMGEGAGMLVLEDYEHAVRRGARIYCEVAGYGSTCDAYHMTAPEPDGKYSVKAMSRALENAGMGTEDIQYINAHGTSTVLNDRMETRAIKNMFGEQAYRLKVSSIKSMLGHCIGAAGAIEAISSALTLYHQWIPPTINYENPDPECDLDYVPGRGISAEVSGVMSNSFGFGGHNSVLVFRRI